MIVVTLPSMRRICKWFYIRGEGGFKLKRVTGPAPVSEGARGSRPGFGGRRTAMCLAEEVLGVRGIPKTNKRRIKSAHITKCDFVAVAKMQRLAFCFPEWGKGEGKLL